MRYGPAARVVLAILLVTGVNCDRAATQPAAPPDPLTEFQRNSPGVIAQYLRDHPVRKLQIGAGSSRLQGWLNTDIEPGNGLAYLDATKRFPFDDGTLHYIFSEHVIEHLTYDEGKAMAAEAFRVLAPGGRMRIATPDLAQFIALFDANPGAEAKAYTNGKLEWHDWPREPNPAAIILNLQMSSWGHKFLYDAPTLAGVMSRAGFVNTQEFEENSSNDPQLRDLEARNTGAIGRWNAYETMVLEVEKPKDTTRLRE